MQGLHFVTPLVLVFVCSLPDLTPSAPYVSRDTCRSSSRNWSYVLVGVFFRELPSGKLNMLQPGSHVTTGSLSIEQAEEIFTKQAGSMDHFDWFKDYNFLFFTRTFGSYIERFTESVFVNTKSRD